jgi:hypothetical protein
VRFGWEEIVCVDQDRATNAMVLIGSNDRGLSRRVRLPVPAKRGLLAFAQERVNATRILGTHIAVDGRQVWVEARRQPATSRLHWLVHPDGGVDPDDAAQRGKIDRALAELRAALGV